MVEQLSDEQLAKGRTYVRALRRAIINFWYATVEDEEAALIEAATASLYVNIVDEAVLEAALGEAYRSRRQQGIGRVVMGLELIRNCETHASGLAQVIVSTGLLSVPTIAGISVYRNTYRWADLAELPDEYVRITGTETVERKRARSQALDGYRKEVAGRPVIDVLFDALRFFGTIDPRLSADPPAGVPAYALDVLPLVQVDDGARECDWTLSRPMGLDNFELVLPDLACRPTERRAAEWPSADRALEQSRRGARKTPPSAECRQITHVIRDNDRVVGYCGMTGLPDASPRASWLDRAGQVWFDVRGGYRYYVSIGDDLAEVTEPVHQRIEARSASTGIEWIELLEASGEERFSLDYLEFLEANNDLYLQMRGARD